MLDMFPLDAGKVPLSMFHHRLLRVVVTSGVTARQQYSIKMFDATCD